MMKVIAQSLERDVLRDFKHDPTVSGALTTEAKLARASRTPCESKSNEVL